MASPNAQTKKKAPEGHIPLPKDRPWKEKRFAGHRIAFTGRLLHLRKKELEKILKLEGAVVVPSVTATTTIVVYVKKGSAKEKKARKIQKAGAPLTVVREDEFRRDFIRPTAEQTAGMLTTGPGRKRLAELLGLNREEYSWGTDEFSSVVIEGISLEGVNLSKAVLAGVLFRDVRLDGANISKVVRLSEARGVSFQGAKATGAGLYELEDCDLSQADLTKAEINGAARCNFTNANLRGASLLEELEGCDFKGATFDQGDWYGTEFSDCTFEGASFRSVKMEDVCWSRCDLRGADFREAVLHPRSDAVEVVNCDLRGADFRGAELVRHTFRKCKLDGARFDGAKLVSVKFEKSNPEAAKKLVWAPPPTGPSLQALHKASKSYTTLVITTPIRVGRKKTTCEIHSFDRGTWIQVHAGMNFRPPSISEAMVVIGGVFEGAVLDEGGMKIKASSKVSSKGTPKGAALRELVLEAWREAFG